MHDLVGVVLSLLEVGDLRQVSQVKLAKRTTLYTPGIARFPIT